MSQSPGKNSFPSTLFLRQMKQSQLVQFFLPRVLNPVQPCFDDVPWLYGDFPSKVVVLVDERHPLFQICLSISAPSNLCYYHINQICSTVLWFRTFSSVPERVEPIELKNSKPVEYLRKERRRRRKTNLSNPREEDRARDPY